MLRRCKIDSSSPNSKIIAINVSTATPAPKYPTKTAIRSNLSCNGVCCCSTASAVLLIRPHLLSSPTAIHNAWHLPDTKVQPDNRNGSNDSSGLPFFCSSDSPVNANSLLLQFSPMIKIASPGILSPAAKINTSPTLTSKMEIER